MRRACAYLTVAAALSLPGIASAEATTASITAFKAVPVAISGGAGGSAASCTACGTGLELEYVFAGEGCAATAMNPKGGIPPLSGVNPQEVHASPIAAARTRADARRAGAARLPDREVERAI
jgi:hypothetical protein